MKTLGCVLTAAAVLMWVTAAHAANDCRTNFVTSSIDNLAENSKEGGHIAKHIIGEPTEKGESFWAGANSGASWDSFKAGFAKWLKITKYKKVAQCGQSGSETDCVPIQYFGGVVANRLEQCTAVDKNGQCTATKKRRVNAVAFGYLNSVTKTGGKWIMNTAFPSYNSTCTP